MWGDSLLCCHVLMLSRQSTTIQSKNIVQYGSPYSENMSFSKKYCSLKHFYILQRAFSYWIFDHFWGFFLSDFFSRNCVCVWEKGIFFSRISGCCSLYFQWDVLSSLWAKGFFVDLSCSYFTFFQFHICFQFWVFLEMVLKIIFRFLFLVYLTIFRSSCRLKYILGYRYSCK